MQEAILAIDVGSGTQDILLYLPGKNLENCPKLIMPSRTQIVAQQIRKATSDGIDLYLSGNLMGGGACAVALRLHIKAGYKVFATAHAAKTFNDNLELVKSMGVEIVSEQPAETRELILGDVDLPSLAQALHAFGLELPNSFAIALQDHGEALEISNREFRLNLWRDFILSGGELGKLLYSQSPSYFTRMSSVQASVPNAWVMDTGAAAVWGILCDRVCKDKQEQGFVALNVGNSHTLGVLVKGTRVLGIFEHHTGLITPQFLAEQVVKFKGGSLTHEEVFAAGGHGAYIHPDYTGDFDFVALTGPRWEMAGEVPAYRVAPHGDMMLTGCFGLISALEAQGY
ncbi:MAG TPA: DUF1786 domain-containing protein [Candidatus Deferrimicrobium sp.]|nr:DUF1786 domain-containing protein [Candidatus Deferrimicrobium sp.]